MLCLLSALLLAAFPLQAATAARIVKVLPQFVDLKGRNSLSPSLYERDAYQVFLRDNPEKRSGMRFLIQWKTKDAAFMPRKMKLELRGVAEGNLPREMVLEQPAVRSRSLLGNWTEIGLLGEEYKKFGAVTAWRVTLWEGDELLAEERSFLW
jgi:hypothetical protein